MKSHATVLFLVLFVLILTGCTQETNLSSGPISPYKWVESDIAPTTANFITLKVGDDNALYASGRLNNVEGVHKYDGKEWSTLVVFPCTAEDRIIDFAVLQGQLFYTSVNGMFVVNNSGTSVQVDAVKGSGWLEQSGNEIIMAGDKVMLNGDTYANVAISSDLTIKPLMKYWTAIKKINGYVYITGEDSYQYSSAGLNKIDFIGQSSAIDNIGRFYQITSNAPFQPGTIVTRYDHGQASQVGAALSFAEVRLTAFDCTMVMTTCTPDATVYLDSKDQWQTLPTPFGISSLVHYNNDLLATNLTNGGVMRLTK